MADTILADIAVTVDPKVIQHRSTKKLSWVIKDTAGANVDLTTGGARLAIRRDVSGVGMNPVIVWDEINDFVMGNGIVELPFGVAKAMALQAGSYLGQLFVSTDNFANDIRMAWAGSFTVNPTLW